MLKNLQWRTGFLRRMLSSVVMARWQGYEERVGSERTWFIFYFHRDLARGARIPAFVDPYCVSFPLCSYFILLIHLCSQWSPRDKYPARNEGTHVFAKVVLLDKTCKTWLYSQFSGILFASFCNRFKKINFVSFRRHGYML